MKLTAVLFVVVCFVMPSHVLACEVGGLFIPELNKYYDDWQSAPKDMQAAVLEYITDSDYIEKLEVLDCTYHDFDLKKSARSERMYEEITNKIFEKWETTRWNSNEK